MVSSVSDFTFVILRFIGEFWKNENYIYLVDRKVWLVYFFNKHFSHILLDHRSIDMNFWMI